jgi:hypothetical protein
VPLEFAIFADVRAPVGEQGLSITKDAKLKILSVNRGRFLLCHPGENICARIDRAGAAELDEVRVQQLSQTFSVAACRPTEKLTLERHEFSLDRLSRHGSNLWNDT